MILLGELQKSDIARLASRFGDEFREKFNGYLEDRMITYYSNTIAARHEAGHKRGSNVTVADVRNGQIAADHILGVLSKCFDEICE